MNQKVNAFAMKYLDLYRNPKTTNIQVEETFADECFALGFEMDSGNSFCEKYPKAFNDVQEFDRIIEEISDPQFLGTAIFSQWRYITHWSYNAHPLDSEYRVTTDHYGRKVPKHAHGTANLDRQTSSTMLIVDAVMSLFDRIVDKNLLIRRITLAACKLIPESEAATAEVAEQLTLFTDYEALERQRKEQEEALAREKKMQHAMLDIKKEIRKERYP